MTATSLKMNAYWAIRILMIVFPSVMLHSIHTQVFIDGNYLSLPICEQIGERDCVKTCFCLKDTDVCSLNPRFLNESLINETRETIDECNSAEPISCDEFGTSKYRSIDGRCNNLQHPHWGMAGICQQRLLPYDYADGKSAPKISCQGKSLPNARTISNKFHNEFRRDAKDIYTTMHTEWGQLLAHDMSLNDIFKTNESGGNTVINCCLPNGTINDMCLSFDVPPDDPYYPRCINIVRTVPCPRCTNGLRQHWNQNTAFIDGSPVYASNIVNATQLRSKVNGKMDVQTSPIPGVGDLPPPTPIQELCESISPTRACLKTGDTRGNQNRWIISLHTMMLRYHNKIATELKYLNPHWNDETIYQETRRIVGGIIQHITYSEYLPTIVGKELMDRKKLSVLKVSECTTYDPTIDSTMIDEFVVAAFRYGHTELTEKFTEIDIKTGHGKERNVSDFYYYPFDLYEGKYDETIVGMTMDCQMKHDRALQDDFRELTYRRLYFNETLGVDLAALSVVRSREHAIPGYTYYLKYFFNVTVKGFCDLKKFMSEENAKKLQNIYSSVHDINLYSGGLAERHVKDGIVGPTFAALICLQFYNLKYGDRYYFEHCNQSGSFTREQQRAIKRVTLASIICHTTKAKEVPINVFVKPSILNPSFRCTILPKLDLFQWKEKKALFRKL